MFLGVEMRTPNDVVYGETNSYQLFELCNKMHTLLVKINENGSVQITKQCL